MTIRSSRAFARGALVQLVAARDAPHRGLGRLPKTSQNFSFFTSRARPNYHEIVASDDLKLGLVTWYHTDHEGSVKRTTVNGIQRTWQGYDAFGNPLAGSPRSINGDAAPLLLQFDAFKKEGARLGSSQAMAAPHYGNAWTTDAPNTTQQWQIGVGQKARPAAGSAAPGNLNPAGRALVDLGELDGSVTATLSENVADPVQPNGSAGTLDGYATGLVARGGAVTLWIETPTATQAAQPGRGAKARKFRLIDAENNVRTLTFDPAAAAVSTAVSGTNDLEGWTRLGDKVMLTLAGTRAEVWVNDTKVATATLGATSASSTLPTTWGLTFRTGSGAGVIPAGRKLDGWDNFSLKATLPQTRFGYTGAEWDPETGLYHLGPRLYDPKTGRFLQQDPNPPTFEDARNPYRYAWGDPVNYTDPSGMSAFRSAGSAIGSALGQVVAPHVATALNAAADGLESLSRVADKYLASHYYNTDRRSFQPNTSDQFFSRETANQDVLQTYSVYSNDDGTQTFSNTFERRTSHWFSVDSYEDTVPRLTYTGSPAQIARLAKQSSGMAYTQAELASMQDLVKSMEQSRDILIESGITVATGGAGQAVSWLRNAAHVAQAAGQARRANTLITAGKALSVTNTASETYQVGSGVVNGVIAARNGDYLDAAISFGGAGLQSANIASQFKDTSAFLRGTVCFLAGTSVLMSDQTQQAIDEIRVGERVATDGGASNNIEGIAADDPNATAVDPEDWRLVTITAGDWQVQSLQPLVEIAANRRVVGAPVDLGSVADLAEMGVPDGLIGTVDSISECPPIESGSGRVVLTTVNHLNDFVFNLTLTGSDGDEDTLGITGYHKVFTEDRGWVIASALTQGEVVRTAYGDAVVSGLERDPGTFTVYNLTVEEDHIYYAGDLSALVHNTCPNPYGRTGDLITQQTRDSVIRQLRRQDFTQIDVERSFLVGRRGLSNRFADVVGTNPSTGQRAIVQIGNVTNGGVPVSRERRALTDIFLSPGYSSKTDLVYFVEKGSK